MATFYDPNKDKENQDGTGAPAAPLQTSAPSGTIQGGSGSAAPGGAPTATGQQGTGYVNLQKYLNANQGRGAGMATNLSGNISADADKGTQDLADDSDKFKKGIDSNVYKYDYNRLASGQDAQRAVSAQTWNGPTAYNNGGVQAEIDKANGRIQGTSDPNNVREQWTAQNNTTGNYGGGKAAFDSSLMNGDSTATSVFQGLRDKYNNYGNAYTDAQSANNAYAGTAAQTNAQNAKLAKDNAGRAATDFTKTVTAGNQAKIDQRNSQLADELARSKNIFQNPDAFGYDYSVQGPKVGNIYSGIAQPTIAQINALRQLSGQGQITGQGPLFADQGQVTKKEAPIDFSGVGPISIGGGGGYTNFHI